jgi:hypothetical protein
VVETYVDIQFLNYVRGKKLKYILDIAVTLACD